VSALSAFFSMTGSDSRMHSFIDKLVHQFIRSTDNWATDSWAKRRLGDTGGTMGRQHRSTKY